MTLIQAATDWAKGEVVESALIAITGVIVLVAAALFVKYGATVNSKSMTIPFGLVGALFLVMGVIGVVSNSNNVTAFEQQARENPAQFIQAEKQRVEGFEKIFAITYPMGAIAIVVGTVLFLALSGSQVKAAGLALIFLGLTTFVVDYFAHERGDGYYQQLLELEKR